MKICPKCREEFFDHIEICYSCKEHLVDERQAQNLPQDDALLSKEALLTEDTIPLVQGNLTHCREIEKILTNHKVPSVVYPLNLNSSGSPSTLGSSCQMKYAVLIRANEMDSAREALEGQFKRQVSLEGQGQVAQQAVDLCAETVTCPACGETGELVDGECSFCGLALGVEGLGE